MKFKKSTTNQKGTQTSPLSESPILLNETYIKSDQKQIEIKLSQNENLHQFSSLNGQYKINSNKGGKKETSKYPSFIQNQAFQMVNHSSSTPSRRVKKALSNSICECIRAVFAAFIWHEGILHDAMACASYLKFNSSLSKEQIKASDQFLSSTIKYRQSSGSRTKAKFRHSVEVSQLSALQHACIKNGDIDIGKDLLEDEASSLVKEEPKKSLVEETAVPQTLVYLLILWEEISQACLMYNEQPPASLISSVTEKYSNNSTQKLNRFLTVNQQAYLGKEGSDVSSNAESKNMIKCDLCGFKFLFPVTEHMRQAHPGCGKPSGGIAYKGSGFLSNDWVGNCGEGGVGNAYWYLMCESCRTKYIRTKKDAHTRPMIRGPKLFKESHSPLNPKPNLSNSKVTSLSINQLIKENALFLLRLSSANDNNLRVLTLKSKQNQEFSTTTNFMFQCLEALGISQKIYFQRMAEENLSEDEIRAIQNERPSLADQEWYSSNSGGNAREFHRSVSTGLDDSLDSSNGTSRKRAISNDTSGSLVLCQPSSFLINLIKIYEQKHQPITVGSSNFQDTSYSEKFPHNRPIMSFILQQHNLENLNSAMILALRKVSCRYYALQALDWHLKQVSQPSALHDLIWSFVSAITYSNDTEKSDSVAHMVNNYLERKDFFDLEVHYQANSGISRHPTSDLSMAGEAVKPLQEIFHSVLQTISNLMLLLPMGSPIQQMAIRSFCLHFDYTDHSFLHRSHVFSNISKILSRNEEDTVSQESSAQTSLFSGESVFIQSLLDITSQLEIKASSRQAMIDCLLDNSTETFWESGDEDRNRPKFISIVNLKPDVQMVTVYIHVDNCRNPGSKVSRLSLKCCETVNDDLPWIKLKSVDIDNQFSGWVYLPLLDNHCFKVVRVEIKGPDHNIRLRQLKVMGTVVADLKNQLKEVKNCSHLQQLNCEAETLRVFRLLTSQVSDEGQKVKINFN